MWRQWLTEAVVKVTNYNGPLRPPLQSNATQACSPRLGHTGEGEKERAKWVWGTYGRDRGFLG